MPGPSLLVACRIRVLCAICRHPEAAVRSRLGRLFKKSRASQLLAEIQTIKANMDMNALTLGKMLSFCGQFIDGQAVSMLLQEDGEWKVDPEQILGHA